MDDLIRRKALLDCMPKDDQLMSIYVRRCICDAPAVDAVEVVRCKDCVNMGKRPPLPKGYREDCGWCVMNGHAVLPEDFCSNGETADEKCRREAAEQDAYEQLCNLGNPEDGSL